MSEKSEGRLLTCDDAPEGQFKLYTNGENAWDEFGHDGWGNALPTEIEQGAYAECKRCKGFGSSSPNALLLRGPVELPNIHFWQHLGAFFGVYAGIHQYQTRPGRVYVDICSPVSSVVRRIVMQIVRHLSPSNVQVLPVSEVPHVYPS